MKIKSLYISYAESFSESLVISMGLMEILRRNVKNIAFFKPIVASKENDPIVSFMLEYYGLNMEHSQAIGFEIEEVKAAVANGKTNEIIQNLISKFKTLEKQYDFIICEGAPRSLLSSIVDFDLNLEFAKNLNLPIVNLINGKNRTSIEIFDSLRVEANAIRKSGCVHFSTFVNRITPSVLESVKKEINALGQSIYLLPEVEELSSPTIEEIKETLGCKLIFGKKEDLGRVAKHSRVISMNIENALPHFQDGDLVITAGDRTDIILGVLTANISDSYPTLSGILLSGNLLPKESFLKLIEGLPNISIPILSTKSDTFETVLKLKDAPSYIKIDNERKIALAIELFSKCVNIVEIEKSIADTAVSGSITPIMFEHNLFEIAKKNKKRIVLPESNDDRILRAAEILIRRDVVDIILLGKIAEVKAKAASLGIDINKAVIVDPNESELMDRYINEFYELRKSKGLSLERAKDAMDDYNYFATMMVYKGDADGMVSGAIHTTGETIRPALQIIKTKPGISIISSVFFMCLDTKVLVYGDCAVNKDPNSEELAQIAISSADTAKSFGIEPKVAMLSYSTGNSGEGEDVEKVKNATQTAKDKRSDLMIEGPIQYDAAIDPIVAKTKLPNSKVAGNATVFIFPDLNTGNNTYKAVQRSSNALAIGPVLQGLKKPVNDLSRGCLVADIVNTVVITAIQAAQID